MTLETGDWRLETGKKSENGSSFCISSHQPPATSHQGFTLIETMVAVTILTLAIAGPLYAASRAIVAAQIARDQLTASYLAQEGIEYVRAMRDDTYLAAYQAGGVNISANAWNNFVSGAGSGSIAGCKDGITCTLDPAQAMGTGNTLSLSPCSGSLCTPLYLANGIYTEQSTIPEGVRTPFTRTITAVTVSANDERIISTVSLLFHGFQYSVTVTDHLTPWQ